MLKYIIKITALVVSLFFVSCQTDDQVFSKPVAFNDSLKTQLKIDTIVKQDSSKSSGFYYCSSPESGKDNKNVKKMLGKILPDTEDSTLLTFVYGSCVGSGENFTYNRGPQIWNEKDSVYMKVAERLGSDSIQIIYIRGEMAITCVMHNFFNESALILHKTAGGWKVMDAYIDAEVVDYESVEIAGEYNNRFLLKYETSGIYAYGVTFGSVTYTFMDPDSFNGPKVDFIMGRSNTMSDQCSSKPEYEDYHCNCYSAEGKVSFEFNKKKNCLVFNYEYENEVADCEFKKPVKEKTRQTWYMNAHTCFLAKGNELSEWGEHIVGKIKLSEAEVQKLLKEKS